MVAGQQPDYLYDSEAGRTAGCFSDPIAGYRRSHLSGRAAGGFHLVAGSSLESSLWSLDAAHHAQWFPAQCASRALRAASHCSGDRSRRGPLALEARSFAGASAAGRALGLCGADGVVWALLPDPGSHTGSSLVAAVMAGGNSTDRASGIWTELAPQTPLFKKRRTSMNNSGTSHSDLT